MKNPKRYTITAALPYANGPLHIGHIAGAYLPADIFVRYQKSIKNDVKGILPPIYLIHGDLTDEEMNQMYNHPKL